MYAKACLVVADPSMIMLFMLLSDSVSYDQDMSAVVQRDMSEPSTVKVYCEVIIACLPTDVSSEWTPRDDRPANNAPFLLSVPSSLIPLIEALCVKVRRLPHLLKAIQYQMSDSMCPEKIADTMVAMVQFSMRKTPLVIHNIASLLALRFHFAVPVSTLSGTGLRSRGFASPIFALDRIVGGRVQDSRYGGAHRSAPAQAANKHALPPGIRYGIDSMATHIRSARYRITLRHSYNRNTSLD